MGWDGMRGNGIERSGLGWGEMGRDAVGRVVLVLGGVDVRVVVWCACRTVVAWWWLWRGGDCGVVIVAWWCGEVWEAKL